VPDSSPPQSPPAPGGETCPYCGKTFFASAGRDPLRQHIDYCEKAPDVDEDVDVDEM
jgi:hypothetical protein